MHKAALQELTAISPLDGRYWARVAPLADFFSEYALHKYRVPHLHLDRLRFNESNLRLIFK